MAHRLMQRTMAGTNPGIGARSATAEATDVPWRDQQGATETPVIWDSLPQVSARVCRPHHALAWVAPRYVSRGHPSVSHYPASFVVECAERSLFRPASLKALAELKAELGHWRVLARPATRRRRGLSR